MIITLLLVPLTLDYLDTETFGVWTTLSSVLTLLAFFDVGLGNGLRNKLSEALSKNDLITARSYVSTAYVLFGTLQLGILCLFIVGNEFIPWQSILNTTLDLPTLRQLAIVLMVGISFKLVLDLLTFILYARQNSAQTNLLLFFTNLSILLGVFIATKISKGNLVLLGIITAFSPVFILLIASVIYYKKVFNYLRPSISLYDRRYVSNLLSIGYKFFFIQIAVIIVFYTDNLIVTQLFGPSEVTVYNISFRYFNIINTIFAIAIAPFWSAFTEAHIKQEYDWMKTNYKWLLRLWCGVVILVIVWIIAAPMAYKVWVGDRVAVPKPLNIFMGISVIIACFNNVSVVVTNGLGKIKLQLLSSLFSAFINIPLAIFLGKYLEMGSAGVIAATSVSLLSSSIVCVIQAGRLINQTATGIWNR